ncbi:MAG: hypothetical protein N2712_07955, partial [Brevinematales bacterium]|nr:hypothetical protein [Brevinematales bacterium]
APPLPPKGEWKPVEEKTTTTIRRDAPSDGVNRCKTEVGIPLEILREYDFGYQTNRIFMAFIVFPNSLKEIGESIVHVDSAKLFQSYFPYHVNEVKLSGIGSVTPTTLSEESFLTVLPKYQKITEVSTAIPSFYYKGLSNANIGIFLQKWMGLLGWKSSPYNYMGYIKEAFQMNKSKLTTSLYKGNILICSFKQNALKQITESDAKKVVGYEDIYESEKEKKFARSQNFKGDHVGYFKVKKTTYGLKETKPIEENYRFSVSPYTLEEVFLCLGVYPKNISGIGDYSRDFNSFRQYDITWNVDLILTNLEIEVIAQNLVNDYMKQLFNVKKFDEYSTFYDGSDKSGTRYNPPQTNPAPSITKSTVEYEVINKEGKVVHKGINNYTRLEDQSIPKEQRASSSNTSTSSNSGGGLLGGLKDKATNAVSGLKDKATSLFKK